MSADFVYIRRCPSCDTENPPKTMRCVCGALLTGVDLSLQAEAVPAGVNAASIAETVSTVPPSPNPNPKPEISSNLLCGYEDCAQENPSGSASCLYCNRPLAIAEKDSKGVPANSVLDTSEDGQIQSLFSLPSALSGRFQIVRPLAGRGAEAELLLALEIASQQQRVVKIYRHGVQVRADVRERLQKIPAEHCVMMLESGLSDGYSYEVMEYCEHGSLRVLLSSTGVAANAIPELVRELATAIHSVHQAGLLHRDLKPETF